MERKKTYKVLVSMNDELKNALHRITSETGITLAEFIKRSVTFYIKHISERHER